MPMQLSSTILLSIIHTFSNEYLPKHTFFLTNNRLKHTLFLTNIYQSTHFF